MIIKCKVFVIIITIYLFREIFFSVSFQNNIVRVLSVALKGNMAYSFLH